MRVAVKRGDKSRLRFVSIRQDVTEKTCRDSMGLPILVVPESVTYTVETDGEWDFDWYGVNGKFFRFNKE
jgi:hypothetical protein